MATLKEDWYNALKGKSFDFPVIDCRTGDSDCIAWCIEATDKSLIARTGTYLMTNIVEVDFDKDFGIDTHIDELHSKCLYAIIEDPNYDDIDI